MAQIALNWQPQPSAKIGWFSLPVLADAYTAMGRVIQLTFKYMVKALVGHIYDMPNPDTFSVYAGFFDNNGGKEKYSFDIIITESTTPAQLKSLVETAILDRSTVQSYGMSASDIKWGIPTASPALLNLAPMTGIADAPADAVTNYNIVTTLLGTLTSAVNTANTKQNDIATKLNSVISALETVGILVTV